jgi:hypothetical protein
MAVMGCKLRSVRRTRGLIATMPMPYTNKGYRWVKIQGTEYLLKRDLMSDWLCFWGKLASDITEEKIEDERDDSESGHEIGNGAYSVKMKLDANLPQCFSMLGM